jgi:beta-fructofuranosidase
MSRKNEVEERYRKLEDADIEVWKTKIRTIAHAPWRQTYHIQPPIGRLGDPNGFSFFHNQWHLFHQWSPLSPTIGLAYWRHLVSQDLINWKDMGISIRPDCPYDSHGAYSGSALTIGDKLTILYTGNVRDDENNRHAYQIRADYRDGEPIDKFKKPVIFRQPEGYTAHFRDPKMWRAADGSYYLVIGAQTADEEGGSLVYHSSNAMEWHCAGRLNPFDKKIGYMWECPNLFWLDEEPVFLFCPQGLDKSLCHYQNVYPSAYVVGQHLDLKTMRFNPVNPEIHLVDKGFDFYAPQVVSNADRTVLVGWMGVPEVNYPTEKYGWSGCLTLPRELKLSGGKLLQQPVDELKDLRGFRRPVSGQMEEPGALSILPVPGEPAFELDLTLTGTGMTTLNLREDRKQNKKLRIRLNFENGLIEVDRRNSGVLFGEKFGTKRYAHFSSGKVRLHIFIDQSSFELFVDEGSSVLSGRFFPDGEQVETSVVNESGTVIYSGNHWNLKNVSE